MRVSERQECAGRKTSILPSTADSTSSSSDLRDELLTRFKSPYRWRSAEDDTYTRVSRLPFLKLFTAARHLSCFGLKSEACIDV